MDRIIVNETKYDVIKLLGKGKGGYSYLVKNSNYYYVLKQIHHEPCSYYSFGNKLESELKDYNILSSIGIKLPKLIDVDYNNERIIKEYIDGETIDKYVLNDLMNLRKSVLQLGGINMNLYQNRKLYG